MKNLTIIIILSFLGSINISAEGSREQDSLALVAFYNALDGPNWKNNDGWLTDKPIDEWHGVKVANDRLKSLILIGNYLSGVIPIEIGELTNLTELNLFGNKLNGGIPKEIGQLIELQKLQLSQNDLSGEIPAEIGKLNNLYYLEIMVNELSGTIPKELGKLTKLKTLALLGNKLTGGIPKEIGQLIELQSLHLSTNEFSGEIPAEIGLMKELSDLDLSQNLIVGIIPETFKNLSKLKDLNFSYCNLSGGLENLPEHYFNNINIEKNNFDFGDFSSSNINSKKFSYYPQKDIGEEFTAEIEVGQSFSYKLNIDDTEGNIYKWYKYSELIENNSIELLIENAGYIEDTGIYECEVTNAIAPDLVLKSKPLKLIVREITSILEPQHKRFVFFPNPATDKLTIELPNEKMQSIEIRDMKGKLIMNEEIHLMTSSHQMNIDALTNGTYFITVTTESGTYTEKFVKVK